MAKKQLSSVLPPSLIDSITLDLVFAAYAHHKTSLPIQLLTTENEAI